MIEKILKDTYVNPKVELTQTDYNRLVQTAQMKAKKIEERAREIYEKEGVTKIQFTGRFYRKHYGEVECDKHEFTVDCNDYGITPTGEFEKTLYKIPLESRQKIAKCVKNFVEESFECYFGEHMLNLNEIERLKHKQQQMVNKFIIWTVVGWLLAITAIFFILIS
jgi:hypothetical protein